MKELAIVPIVALLVISIGTQLVDVAEHTGDKVVKYSEDMGNAVDCAFLGQSISKCSPELTTTDFDSEINQTADLLEQLEEPA